jgi:predicted N-acetyltransferase YhbS
MKEQIIDLWKISFGDSDAFIRLWFERVYKDEQTVVIRQNGKIVSALQILPCEMTYNGTTIPAGYICGVCTLPSERGKGLMNQLMLQALEEMRKRDYALATLIPATPGLFDVYRRFEFANAFDYSIEVIQSGNSMNTVDADICIVSYENLPLDTLFACYHSKQCERNNAILHSACQFETICQDRILGGGNIWVALANDQPVGMAFTDPINGGETLSIREIMYDNPATKNQLVQSILNRYQLHSAKLRIPPTLPNSVPYGMARIINKELMIRLYRSSLPPPTLPDFSNLTVPSLTQILLNYDRRQACMNLMLD